MAELHASGLGCTHIVSHLRVRYCSTHLEELGGHTLEGIAGPLTEPVNGAAVDKGGELAQPRPAGVGACLGGSTVSSRTISSDARACFTQGQDNPGSAVAKVIGSKRALQRSSVCVIQAICQCTVYVLNDVISTALPGNRPRPHRKASPTGDMARTMCRLERHSSTK